MFCRFIYAMLLAAVVQVFIPGSLSLSIQLGFIVFFRLFVPLIIVMLSRSAYYWYYITIGIDQIFVLEIFGYVIGYYLSAKSCDNNAEISFW